MKHQNIIGVFTVGAILLLLLFLVACSSAPATPDVTPIATKEESSQTASSGDVAVVVEGIATTVAERTPVPTTTPGPVERAIGEVAAETGLAESSFLGLTAGDWINLLASILFVVIGYLLGAWLLFGLLERIVQRTPTDVDDSILEAVERPLKWLVLIVVGRIAFLRLDFWSDEQIIFLDDLFFLFTIITLTIIALSVLAYLIDWVMANRVSETNRKQLRPLIALLRLLGILVVVFFALSFVLNHFGVNITLVSGAFLFAALIVIIIGYAAKGAISDVVSGLIILTDQPFLVGDDLHLMELDIWGEVTAVGLRTTSIRTVNNREVIVPNSMISASQIINYSRPIPEIRIQTELNVPYGTDMEKVRQIIHDTVREIEGVLPDKPVSVYYLRYDDAARVIRVYWYVDSIRKKEPVQDQVNSAIERALLEGGIEIPFPTYNLLLKQRLEDKRSNQ